MSRADSPLANRMIFAVGARRSGTNWLQRMLASHPDVAAVPGESFFFSHGIRPLTERIHHGAAASPMTTFTFMEREDLLDALRDFCDRVFLGVLATIGNGATHLVERTPTHVHDLDLIGAIYPEAPVVHIVRDGRDVARSLLAHNWGPQSMSEAAAEWRDAVTAGRAAAPRLKQYVEVRYEELLADPATRIPELYAALGLDVASSTIDAARREAKVAFNVDATQRVIAAEKWRTDLSAADLAAFDAVAGDALELMGYTRDAGGAAPAVGERLRAAADVAVRRVKKRVRPPSPVKKPAEPEHSPLEIAQYAFDRFLGAIHARRYDDAEQLLTPNTLVRVVHASGEQRARGPEGVTLLRQVLEADEPYRRRQRRGDTFPSGSTFTAVLAYEGDDGQTHDRVMVVTLARGRITSVTLYQMPLGG
jgi:hypothetical protein